MFDALARKHRPSDIESAAAFDIFLERQRKQIQGYTSGTLVVEGEDTRARELAHEAVREIVRHSSVFRTRLR